MTAWSRAGSSYVCECRPGYEAVVELSGACAYAAPWGTVERAEGAVLTVVEQATGLAVAKRLRIAGATSPGDVDDVARRVSDARIGEEAAKAEDLATRGWHLDGPAGILSVAARGSRAAAEHPLSLGRLGGAPGGAPNGSSIRECRRRAARTTTSHATRGSTPATWKPIRARTWTSS